MNLYRAIAYQLHSSQTLDEPEVAVFFEASSREAAPAVLVGLLNTAWGIPADQVDYYNLWSQDELRGMAQTPAGPGQHAWLLESGWFHGPLFHRRERTLVMVRPRTLARIEAAWTQAQQLAVQQANSAAVSCGAQRYQRFVPAPGAGHSGAAA